MTEDQIIQAVVGIIESQGKVLILRRDPQQAVLAGRWEFPGGKIEVHESPEAALERELFEELNMYGKTLAFLGENVHHYSYGTVRLQAFHFAWDGGPLTLRVHDRMLWVKPTELLEYDLAEADRPIAVKLAKPQDSLTLQRRFI